MPIPLLGELGYAHPPTCCGGCRGGVIPRVWGHDGVGPACRNALSCNGNNAEVATVAWRPWAANGPPRIVPRNRGDLFASVVAGWSGVCQNHPRTAEREVPSLNTSLGEVLHELPSERGRGAPRGRPEPSGDTPVFPFWRGGRWSTPRADPADRPRTRAPASNPTPIEDHRGVPISHFRTSSGLTEVPAGHVQLPSIDTLQRAH